uniref:Ubiquitin-associated protein 2-like n=1 Tax=Petromyzon marinus TaxID=7757 RepID=A0AAJ7WKS2_PETMA|nr:ubiquitin-associated protein 2-like [Petromyzon marinus]
MASLGLGRPRNGHGDRAHTLNSSSKATPQATAEQIRIQMILEKSDSDFPEKVKQLMEVTSKTEDDCTVALHDCNGDVSKATDILLEGAQDTSVWKTVSKKARSTTTTSTTAATAAASSSSTSSSGAAHLGGADKDCGSTSSTGGGGAASGASSCQAGLAGASASSGVGAAGGGGGGGGGGPGGPRGGGRGGGYMGPRIGRVQENGVDASGRGGADRGRRGRGRGFVGTRGRGRGRYVMPSGSVPMDVDGSHVDSAKVADEWGASPPLGDTPAPDNGSWRAVEDWGVDDWNDDIIETKVFTASSAGSVTLPSAQLLPGQSIDIAALLRKPAPSAGLVTAPPGGAPRGPSGVVGGGLLPPHEGAVEGGAAPPTPPPVPAAQRRPGPAHAGPLARLQQLAAGGGGAGRTPAGMLREGGGPLARVDDGGSAGVPGQVDKRLPLPGAAHGPELAAAAAQAAAAGQWDPQSEFYPLGWIHWFGSRLFLSSHFVWCSLNNTPSAGAVTASGMVPASGTSCKELESHLMMGGMGGMAGGGGGGVGGGGVGGGGAGVRMKTQRRRMPVQSKIPSLAVEMPGAVDASSLLSLQFGALEFGSEPSPLASSPSAVSSAAAAAAAAASSSSAATVATATVSGAAPQQPPVAATMAGGGGCGVAVETGHRAGEGPGGVAYGGGVHGYGAAAAS